MERYTLEILIFTHGTCFVPVEPGHRNSQSAMISVRQAVRLISGSAANAF
jgi:hypothetical protein